MDQINNDAKTRILVASKKLFAHNGYDGTSVRQICEEANTNAALISYYFGGKENVYQALFQKYSPVCDIKPDNGISPAEGVRHIVEGMVRYTIEEAEMLSIIQQEYFMNRQRLQSLFKSISDIWLSLRYFLEKGKEEGIFHFSHTDRTLKYIISLLIFPNGNTILDCTLAEDTLDIEAAVNDTLNFIYRGLCFMPNDSEVIGQ